MNLLASLRYLVALHEHRHFGRAAAACHITQPALSNALRALESEFGVTIVQRGRSFVGFTPEGERVLASARTMLRERELLAQDLSSQSDAPHGTLVIGAVPSAMPVAARFAALLQRRHPGIVPTLRSLSSTDIELGLDELTVDVALGYTDRAGMGAHPPPRRGERRVLAQYTERYYLVSRAPRARAAGLKIVEPMPWREAARRPLCLLTPEMHNRSIVDAAFA
ncbi:MAG: LysR family transcriptional regulator, partial [Burkholderiaceae bacterium]